ncbi:YihA family ribosome biogenesis GTP-binding protein [Candidatus Desantisbacteria bacterium]|nr:YihA family ribosome biogenesis GTP-binding protein [Candidatus Desantisbacteria bacterium]
MEVEFIKSAFNKNQFPAHLFPEVAFVGRSNVGKSSLLNCISGRKKLAHVSNNPGKTKMINFFLIDKKFCFVDLPGYGFAKVSMVIKLHWKDLIESYIIGRENLKLIILILDIRHIPSKDDMLMKQWLDEYNINYIIAATKTDKLSKNQKLKSISIINEILNKNILPFSSFTGEGKKEIWQEIHNNLQGRI